MASRTRFFLLILIMCLISLILTAVSLGVIYQTAIEEERNRLAEIAQSQAKLIEAVARFDSLYSNDPKGATEATLSQIRDAHANYEGFSRTGEFTLARLEGEKIVFLLSHRYFFRDPYCPREIS